MNALLRMGCFPAGMELFPAASEDQWSLIRSAIDESDYFIMVGGGMYGSLDSDGMGFIEKEYCYALKTGKPVLGLLCKDPDVLPANKTERSEEMQKRFKSFRRLVMSKQCRFWINASDLEAAVTTSMKPLIESHPAPGWVRDSGTTSETPSNHPKHANLSIILSEDKLPSEPNKLSIHQCQLYLWDSADAEVLWIKLVCSAKDMPSSCVLYLTISPVPLELRDSSHMYFGMDSLLRGYQIPVLRNYKVHDTISHMFYIAEPGKERHLFHNAYPMSVDMRPCRVRVEGSDHGTYRLSMADFLTYEQLDGAQLNQPYGVWMSCTLPKLLSRSRGTLQFHFKPAVPVERFRFQAALPFGVSTFHEKCTCSSNIFHPHLSTNPLVSYPGWLPLVSPVGEMRDIPIFFNPEIGVSQVEGKLVYRKSGQNSAMLPSPPTKSRNSQDIAEPITSTTTNHGSIK